MDYIAEALALVNHIASLDDEMLTSEANEIIDLADAIRSARCEAERKNEEKTS